MVDSTTITQAIIVLVLAVAAYLRSRSTNPTVNPGRAATNANADQLDTIHNLVNSRLTAALDDIATLRRYVADNARPGDPPVPPTAQHP